MRRLAPPLLALVVLLCLGTASATLLGSFDDVVLSATARTEPACAADTVEFFDILESPLPLGTLAGTDVRFIRLSNFDLASDCGVDVPGERMRPVVILTGIDGLTLQEVVLSRTELGPISGTSDTDLLDVGLDDEINSLLNTLLNIDVPTGARVVFCPEAATQCGVSP